MTVLWVCPNCGRQFARKNQRHHCGTGDGSVVLRGRPGELVKIFGRLEAFIKSLGAVEILARERYMLFRTTRIFADLTAMCDALRLAVHLPREARHRLFIKIGSDRRLVTHVAKIHDVQELEAMKPFLADAYEHSISERARQPKASPRP